MKRYILIALLLALTVPASAQVVPQLTPAEKKQLQPQTPAAPLTLEQIAKQTHISVFVPDTKIAGKLTQEEQEALKLHISKMMSQAMADSYKRGAEDSSTFLMKQFADLVAAAQRQLTDQQQPQQPQFSRLQRVGLVLQGISQGMQSANQNALNCVTNHLGSYSYTKCY